MLGRTHYTTGGPCRWGGFRQHEYAAVKHWACKKRVPHHVRHPIASRLWGNTSTEKHHAVPARHAAQHTKRTLSMSKLYKSVPFHRWGTSVSAKTEKSAFVLLSPKISSAAWIQLTTW